MQLAVDIVIPVYNAREFARRCVESVLKHATGDWRLILVNDASTEPGIEADLDRAASSDARVQVLKNDANLGFVKTANRGMQAGRGCDVLLLNSDTQVFSGFLDRLHACAHADPTTGVVSPLSNNASICSVPEMGQHNPIPEGFTPESFAELVAAASQQRRPELVTAVGFCMYVKADVFRRIGYFDESFGRGSGEENDFCERAKKAGFKIRLCDDVFVLHEAKASFGVEGHALESTHAQLLEAKQPGYHAAVARFFEENPLEPIQRELRFQINRLGKGRQSALLYLLHASPFTSEARGVELHVRDLLREVALPRAVAAYPDGGDLVLAEVLEGNVERPILYRLPLGKPVRLFSIEDEEIFQFVERALPLFGIGAVHVHHLLRWPLTILKAFKSAGLKVIYTSHDYYCVCPSWNLFDFETRLPCQCARTSPGSAGCLPALLNEMGMVADTDLGVLRERHRAAWVELLSTIDTWVFPSIAAREVVRRHFPLELSHTCIIEHGSDLIRTAKRPAPRPNLRLAVVGDVANWIKGADNYVEVVRRTSGLPVEWHFFGRTDVFGFEERVKKTGSSRVYFHGIYRRQEIVNHLAQAGIDLCVVLPKVDETFSFVASESLAAGVPVLALDKGALPERLGDERFGKCVKDVEQAASWIANVCLDRTPLDSLAARVRQFKHRSVVDSAEAHRELYQSLGVLQPVWRPLPATFRELYALRDSQPTRQPPVPRPDAPRYQSSLWYPAFLWLKPFVPKTIRALGRRALVRLEKSRR